MSEAPVGNLARNRLDQVARFARDNGFHHVGDVRVADRVGQIVAVDVEIQFEHHVDDERLTLTAFLWEDTVKARGRQAAERDPIDGVPLPL